MLYTIGNTESYTRYLAQYGAECKKAVGGSVWRTYREASKYLKGERKDDEYSVYGVDANWDTDTEPTEYKWHSLNKDCRIIELIDYCPVCDSLYCEIDYPREIYEDEDKE